MSSVATKFSAHTSHGGLSCRTVDRSSSPSSFSADGHDHYEAKAEFADIDGNPLPGFERIISLHREMWENDSFIAELCRFKVLPEHVKAKHARVLIRQEEIEAEIESLRHLFTSAKVVASMKAA